ncbi:MAG: hypothetical protein H6753_04355 [Candidatus Omnitrophica bacterium]|nr:hypothetical protein [Candidatus Omnitrophota bacterium]
MKMVLTKKDKIQLIVIVGVLIFLVLWLATGRIKTQQAPKDISVVSVGDSDLPAVPFYLKLQAESKKLATYRDPFSRATISSRRKLGELYLAGIFYEPGNSAAVINDQNVRVGQQVEGYEVIAITPLAVTLSKGDQHIVLELE